MIVKNERDVIKRCLLSVKPILDHWVIVDTGSSDGTQSLIEETLKDVPGQLYERPWVNFEKNRNEALDLARGKARYILIMDADEVLQISPSFCAEDLQSDGYLIRIRERSLTDAYRMALIKDSPCWFWKGVIHEALYTTQALSCSLLDTLEKIASTTDGNRSKDPQKFLKDALVLEEALLQDPDNSRYLFYLAQSYGNAGEFEKSIFYYKKRSQMLDDPEEVFWSLYCVGLLEQHVQKDPAIFLESYSLAYRYNPFRAEPLFQMANQFYKQNQPVMSYFLAKEASSLSLPSSCMYMHAWVYEYASLLVWALSAKELGKNEEVASLYQKLQAKNLPDSLRQELAEKLL